MPNKLKNIWQAEWVTAKDYFFRNPKAVKFGRLKSGLPHSFIQIEGKIYAMGQHLDYLGEPGNFGKAKIVQDEQGNNFALKIEGQRAGAEQGRADELAVMRELGHFVGAVDLPYKGKNLWLGKGVIRGKSYTLQTLFEGQNLHDYLQAPGTGAHQLEYKYRPLTERLIIALNMARAVQRLQEKNIVHSDLKAHNMIVDVANGFTVNIIDYAGAQKLAHKNAAGVVRYASPFISPGTIWMGQITLKTDIFAIGTLFDLMGLEHPLVKRMINVDHHQRPDLPEVIQTLEQEIAKQPDLNLYNMHAKRPPLPAITPRLVLGVRTPEQILANYQRELAQRDQNDPFILQLMAVAGKALPQRRPELVVARRGPAPLLWHHQAPVPAAAPVPAHQAAGLDLELLNDFRDVLKTAKADLAIKILDNLAARYAKLLIEKLEQIDILEFIEAYPRNSAKAQAILDWKPEFKAQKHAAKP
jgi:serine/threonine protein kinase